MANSFTNSNVTPWVNRKEWDEVKQWVQSDDSKDWTAARNRMEVWKLRVDRLPAGVECTQSVLDASLTVVKHPQERSLPLTIAAAINRFLNHIIHIGIKLFGRENYYEVAARFDLPEWLVEMRHETTHGNMSSIDMLKSGLSYCFQWIRLNYWEQEATFWDEMQQNGISSRKGSMYESNHNLLDCYNYLKLYSIWGTELIGDLRDQEELYAHIASLWQDIRGSQRSGKRSRVELDDVRIRDAVNTIKNEIQNRLTGQSMKDRVKKQNLDSMIKILTSDELMLPNSDFMDSLNEDSRKGDTNLPDNLLRIWEDVLNLLGSVGALGELLQSLMNIIEDGDEHSGVACGWIMEITTALVDPTDKPKKTKKTPTSRLSLSVNTNDESLQEFVQHAILRPNDKSSVYLPQVLKLRVPLLSKEEERKVLGLVELFMGGKVPNGSSLPDDVKTVLDVMKESVTDSEATPEGIWTLCDDIDWSKVPLGACPDQSIESVDLTLSGDACVKLILDEAPSNVELHETKMFDWSQSVEDEEEVGDVSMDLNESTEETVPAFYRNDPPPPAYRSRGGRKYFGKRKIAS